MMVEIVEGEGTVSGVRVAHPIVTNGDFVAQLCEIACIGVDVAYRRLSDWTCLQ